MSDLDRGRPRPPLDPPPNRAIRQIAVSVDSEVTLWVACDDRSVWRIDPDSEQPSWWMVVRGFGPDPIAPDPDPRAPLGGLIAARTTQRLEQDQRELERQIEELRRRLATGRQ